MRSRGGPSWRRPPRPPARPADAGAAPCRGTRPWRGAGASSRARPASRPRRRAGGSRAGRAGSPAPTAGGAPSARGTTPGAAARARGAAPRRGRPPPALARASGDVLRRVPRVASCRPACASASSRFLARRRRWEQGGTRPRRLVTLALLREELHRLVEDLRRHDRLVAGLELAPEGQPLLGVAVELLADGEAALLHLRHGVLLLLGDRREELAL